MPLFLIPLLAGGLSIKVLEDYFDSKSQPIPVYTEQSAGFFTTAKTIAAVAGVAAITYAVVKWKK
jgi:hypothetical protein